MDGSKPRQINFRMPNADAMRLDMLAQSEGLTTPDYVKRLVYAVAFPGEPVRSRTVAAIRTIQRMATDIDRGPKPIVTDSRRVPTAPPPPPLRPRTQAPERSFHGPFPKSGKR